MTTSVADNTLDRASIEIDIDLDLDLEAFAPRASSRRRWSLLTYPLIAAISAFAAVGILQIGPKGLWDRAQVALHVNDASAAAAPATAATGSSEVVSTPVIVRPRAVHAIDERVARFTPRAAEHAARRVIASTPTMTTPTMAAAPVANPPAHVVVAAPAPAPAPAPTPTPAPAPATPSTPSRAAAGRAPSASLGISGTPNADDVAAANAILQKAKGEHSF
jgi:hypothetical protein